MDMLGTSANTGSTAHLHKLCRPNGYQNVNTPTIGEGRYQTDTITTTITNCTTDGNGTGNTTTQYSETQRRQYVIQESRNIKTQITAYWKRPGYTPETSHS